MDKTETSMMEIAQSKIFADEAKYFSLFEKHIPDLGSDKKVLIYAIDNLGCICRMIEKNPSAQYTIYGNACVNDCVKMMYPSVKTINSDPGNLKEYFINMKFDCILMNPPYDGQTNLYGKITFAAKRHSNIVICLSPYLNYISNKASFKNLANQLEKFLNTYELVDTSTFDAAFDKQLCIFEFKDQPEKTCSFDYLFWKKFSNISYAKSILTKIQKQNDFCDKHVISYNDFDNHDFKCVMTFKRGHFDKINGCPIWDWTTLFSKNYQTKFNWRKTDINTPNCQAIPFATETECINFCNYCNSDIIAFIIYAYKVSLSQSSNLQYIPFLSNYKKSWTDLELQKLFDFTDEEMKYIYFEMKNYGWKTQN